MLAKETQLHLVQKELNKLKEQVKNAENTKEQALIELERAKRTVDDLTQRLKVLNESKDSAVKTTESAKNQAKQIEESKSGILPESDGIKEQDLQSSRENYMSVIAELDAAKQELRKVSQDCDAALEAKVAASNLVAEAETAVKTNVDRVDELSKEILVVQESIGQVKLETLEAQQEQAKVFTDKDALRQSYKATLEESEEKLLNLKNQYDPELTRSLEKQLADTMSEIEGLKKNIENAKSLDLDSVRTVTSELDGAKESLQKVVEEESALRDLVESLKAELENVKKEHLELKEKEAETESIAGNLHVKLRKCKYELEQCLVEESKIRGASEEMISSLQQLSSETENARKEAEEMKNKADELHKEAEVAKIALEEAEKKLKIALEESEGAKAAETRALEQIKTLSEQANAARASTSESGANITISKEELESLNRKVEESDSLAEMKVGAAMAQVEAVKASENEALKKLEAAQKEIEDMKAATQEVLKRAERAEAAKRAVEGELRRWREREQKKAAEAAARILAETEMMVASEASPHHHRAQRQNLSEKLSEARKSDNDKNSVAKKTLVPNISGIFSRKKNQLEGGEGGSPSYMTV